VQFHQFTVEAEEGEQLVLRVTRCTRVPLPPAYSSEVVSTAPAGEGGAAPTAATGDGRADKRASQDDGGAAAAAPSPLPARLSAQASAVSEQLSDLVGARFSTTGNDDAFEAVVPVSILSRRASSLAAEPGAPGAAAWRTGSCDGGSVGGGGRGGTGAVAGQPQCEGGGRGQGRPDNVGLDVPQGLQLEQPGGQQGKAQEQGDAGHQQQLQQEEDEEDEQERQQRQHQEHLQAIDAPAVGAAPAWYDRPDFVDGSDGGGYWGTPVKGGTPQGGPSTPKQRHQQPGASQAGGGSLGAALMRRMANFQEISRMISEDKAPPSGTEHEQPEEHPQLGPQPQEQQQQQEEEEEEQQQDDEGTARGAAALLPAVVGGDSDLPIASAFADAEDGIAEVDADAVGLLAGESSSEYGLGASSAADDGAPDVGPRPASGRSSGRVSRATIDQVGARRLRGALALLRRACVGLRVAGAGCALNTPPRGS
jgi:hypothetical protein